MMKILPDVLPALSRMMASWVLIFFVVAMASSIGAVVNIKNVQSRINPQFHGESGYFPDNDQAGIRSALTRMHLFAGVSLASTLLMAGFGFAVFRRTVAPLNEIVAGLESIQEGNLDVTLQGAGGGETERIAVLINDISANFQEILLLIWNHSESSAVACRRLTELLRKLPDGNRELRETDAIQARIREIQTIIADFHFYDVSLDENKVLTG